MELAADRANAQLTAPLTDREQRQLEQSSAILQNASCSSCSPPATPAVVVAEPDRSLLVPPSSSSEAACKAAVHQAVPAAGELPEGPAGLQLARTVGHIDFATQ